MNGPDRDDDGNPTYEFKASLVGAMCQFKLMPDGLHWRVGRRTGDVRYDRLRAVRLSYRPVTMQSYRFVTEIWPGDQPKIQIVSVSWRSVVSQQRLDAAYTGFITELHRRIAATGGNTQFSTGLPVLTYWIGVAVFSGVLLAIAALALRAVQIAQWSASAIIVIFAAVFAYQLGQYFYRNRPRRYQGEDIPAAVLPKADA
jgi:hypothetical protein